MNMKLVLLSAIALIQCTQVEPQSLPKHFHTRIECAGSLTCITPFCYLSTNADFAATLNVGCTLIRPLAKIYVQQITEQKYGIVIPSYRPIISQPPYEWCQLMYDAERNPFYKIIIQTVSNSVPQLLHQCPYWGLQAAYNMTLNMDRVFSLFAPGEYANLLQIFDDVDKEIFKIKVFTTVRQ